MTRGMIPGLVASAAIALLIGVVLVVVAIGVRRGGAGAGRPPTAASAPLPIGPSETGMLGRKIKARLFYVSEDGTRLTGVEREVL